MKVQIFAKTNLWDDKSTWYRFDEVLYALAQIHVINTLIKKEKEEEEKAKKAKDKEIKIKKKMHSDNGEESSQDGANLTNKEYNAKFKNL